VGVIPGKGTYWAISQSAFISKIVVGKGYAFITRDSNLAVIGEYTLSDGSNS